MPDRRVRDHYPARGSSVLRRRERLLLVAQDQVAIRISSLPAFTS